jgi:hypothetical protein
MSDDEYTASAAVPTNVLAIIALVLGFVVPIGGVVVGILAINQIKRTREAGRGLAVAGIWIGAALTVLTLLPALTLLELVG